MLPKFVSPLLFTCEPYPWKISLSHISTLTWSRRQRSYSLVFRSNNSLPHMTVSSIFTCLSKGYRSPIIYTGKDLHLWIDKTDPTQSGPTLDKGFWEQAHTPWVYVRTSKAWQSIYIPWHFCYSCHCGSSLMYFPLSLCGWRT